MTGPVNDTGAPVSAAQRALWFINRLAPDSAAYNVLFALSIDDSLDPPTLRRAVDSVVARHEPLRSRFRMVGGEVRRFPISEADYSDITWLRVVDASGYTDERLRAAVRAAGSAPFRLTDGEVCRFVLFHRHPAGDAATRASTDVLLIAAHHLVTDLASQATLAEQLLDTYAQLAAGGQLPAANPDTRFIDAIRAETATAGSPRERGNLAYWRELCADAPTVLDLPTDRPRPPVQTFAGDTVRCEVPAELAERLRQAAREGGVTLFGYLLSVVQAVLHRWTGQADLLIGCPATTRRGKRLRDAVGYFVSPLLFRSTVTDTTRFADLLAVARRQLSSGLSHHAYPFAELARTLGGTTDISRPRVFQVAATMQTADPSQPLLDLFLRGEGTASWAGRTVAPFEVRQQEGQFDLAFEMFSSGSGLRILISFDIGLFDRPTIEWVAGAVLRVAAATTADRDQRLRELPVLTAAQRTQLLGWGTGPSRSGPADSAPDVVAAVAVARPAAVALRTPRGDWTYRQLDRVANQIAGLVRSQEVRPNEPVGVLLSRSPYLVAAAQGVMRAGTAYLPLDPSYPVKRLRFMTAEAGVRLVLTGSDHRAKACALAAERTFVLDAPGVLSGQDVRPTSVAADTAYVIYTSGSSGRPKGVAVSRAGLANLVAWQREHYIGVGDATVLQFASVSFDASIWEMFLALGSGGRLVIPPPGTVLTGTTLAATIRAEQVTHVLLPPSVLATIEPEQVPSLRHLTVGGEDCPAALTRSWQQHVVLDNAYGPTEATVISTVHAVAAADGHPPIGRPLPNTRAYVVDPTLGLLPPGVPGELVVAGEHVALGYLNESRQTVRAFITDPVLGEAKAYRTGDRVRWRPDGRLEYQSRMDSQVKVRGFRIEPAEIEAVLDEHPMVRSAAVAPDAAGRLIAYVVIASEPSASPTGVADSTFREFLAERLPAQLVPARYVRLDALPLTPSGKLDRSRLPAPAPTLAAPRGRPPDRGVEQKIALLWSEALALDPGGVGMDDDFGDSGGHSLLAARLMSLVGEEFGVEVSLESFFRHPTPGHLAQLISRPVEQR